MIKLLIELHRIHKETLELLNFVRTPLYHRPEYNIDGGIEMEFAMKRIRKASGN